MKIHTIVTFLSAASLISVLPLFSHAKNWSESSLAVSNPSTTLAAGSTAISLNASASVFSQRLSSAGDYEQLTKINNVQDTKEGQSPDYRTKVTRYVLTPQWSYGILSNWLIGAQLPIIRSEIESGGSAEQDGGDLSSSQLGNVELISKEKVMESYSSKWVLVQRVVFPSAEYSDYEHELQYAHDSTGYAIGMGAAFEKNLTEKWGVIFTTIFDYTLNDRVRLADAQGNMTYFKRNPGDEVLFNATTRYNFLPNVTGELTAAFGQKFSDRYEKHLESEIIENQSASKQVQAETKIAYEMPTLNKFDNHYQFELNYKTTLNGSNVEDVDTLSVRMQMIY